MVFLRGLLKKRKGADEAKPKSTVDTISKDVDPLNLWDIVNELGDGAFGKVYKTTRKEDKREAALKKVDFSSEEELEDYMVEIDILTGFKHPNVLSLLEVYIFDDRLWMFLELCSGGALDTIMNTLEKHLTEPQIRFVSREVLRGLKFLHENLVIHRDMKAGNILLTSTNEIKLADFGVSARLANEKQKRRTFIGTPYWMAPEVIACEALTECPYNWKADVWSFGITLIELAQMRPPYNEINPTRVLLKIAKSDPPKLFRPAYWSPQFPVILARCLQKDPNLRPECVELLLDPFVCDVTDEDRKSIYRLLCEAKADVEDIVEDVDSEELPDKEVDQGEVDDLLTLPESTNIPIDLIEDDEDEGFVADMDTDRTDEHDNSGPNLLPTLSDKPSPDILHSVAQEMANELIEDVISCETRHPSVPSCLFEVMRDLSETVVHTSSPVAEPERLPSPAVSIDDEPKSISKLSRQHSAYRSHTRTRRFVVDGKVVTTTSKRIMRADVEERKLRDEQLNKRKEELRVFRWLGKQEARQTRELTMRAIQLKDQLENKLSVEFMALTRNYEQKMETISRNFRLQLERMGKDHDASLNRIRIESVKDEQAFKLQLLGEVEKYDRADRKAAKRELQDCWSGSNTFSLIGLRNTMLAPANSVTAQQESQQGLSYRVSVFRESKEARLQERSSQLVSEYTARLVSLRREEVMEKQAVRMRFELDKSTMEQRHMRLRHQLARNRLQDFFSIKRQKLAGLLDLERNALQQSITTAWANMESSHALERKNHAKYSKSMSKKSLSEFQRQLRHDSIGSANGNHVKGKLREFEMLTQKHLADELAQHENNLVAQRDRLERGIRKRMRELEEAHASKRNDLIELEVERLQELDQTHERELQAYFDVLPQNQTQLRVLLKSELDQITDSLSASLLADSTSGANQSRSSKWSADSNPNASVSSHSHQHSYMSIK